VQGDKCLVAWSKVQRPLRLGVVDITLLGHALRTGRLWLQRTDSARSWAGLPCQTDPVTESFFKSSINCVVRDGARTFFWSDPWLDGQCIANLAPELVEAVLKRTHNRRMVASALNKMAWIWDISGSLTVLVLI
jgi:hypothetical protein